MPDTEPLTRKQRWNRYSRRFMLIFIVWKLLPLLFPAYTVSPETTYITSPLTPDGYVDYVAAQNEMFGKGIADEDNAAIAVLAAVDDDCIEPLTYKDFSSADWVDDGPKLTPLYMALEEVSVYAPQLERPRVINAEQLAVIAKWLDANEAAIDRIAAASQMSEFYLPMLATPDNPRQPFFYKMPLGVYNTASMALTERARWRADAGDIDGAWEDIFSALRLGRLAARQPGLIGYLIGCSTFTRAVTAAEPIFTSPELAAAQVQAMLRDLDSLPPMPEVLQVIDVGSRIESLSMLDTAMTSSIDGKIPAMVRRFTLNFNGTARDVNAHIDDVATAMRLPDWQSRHDAVSTLSADLIADAKRRRSGWNGFATIVKLILFDGYSMRREMSRMIGLSGMVSPAYGAFVRTVSVTDAAEVVLRAGLACGAYRADHNAWPKDLAALVPDYLDTVPIDPCSNEPLRYRLTDGGLVLYSVSSNFADDGGPPREGELKGDFGYRIGDALPQ